MKERFVTDGPVRGFGGVYHRSLEAAARALKADIRACERQGGYSDRTVKRVVLGGCREYVRGFDRISAREADIVDAIVGS